MALPFTRGDDVELANRVHTDLTLLGPITYDDGCLWQYQPNGVWAACSSAWLTATVAAYAGKPVVASQTPTSLRLSASRVKGTIHLLEQIVRASYSPFNFANTPPGVSFRNGFILVADGKLQLVPHDPTQMARFQYPFDFDPTATCPTWDWYFAGVFTGATDNDRCERIALLQEFAGTALIGQAPRYQAALLLYGPGNNGKSTFEEVLKGAFPPKTTVTLTPQDMSNRFRPGALDGKLLNLVNELPETKLINQDTFKSVISGEPIMVEHKNKDPFELRPKAGHIFSTNTLPSTGDHSHGFYRRFEIVPFTCDMSNNPHQVKDLAPRILENELPGVVAWLLRGAARTQHAKGYTRCHASEHWKAHWRSMSDHVKAFLDENYTADEDCFTPSQMLYDHFKTWSERNGVRRMGKSLLCRRVNGLGFPSVHRGKGNGFRLKPVSV